MKLIDKLATFTNVSTLDTTILTHGIHSYPAKYIPELPREIIKECTKERNIVLDPFCGSGTTLLEASIAGRKSIGIDSNPIATLVSKAKTTVLNDKELEQIDNIIIILKNIDLSSLSLCWIPTVQNLNHWFQENVITELSWLRQFILANSKGNLQNFLLCIYSSIIVNVSNQESNTRYAAKNKNISDGFTIEAFCRKLKQEKTRMLELSQIKKIIKNEPTIICSDTGKVDQEMVPDNSVDIIITSPPYANSYDYYLYHKWRMAWLGYDVKKVQNAEIGSRHEHSSKKAPITVFEQKMIPVMQNLSRMLKPNKLAYFFVGDSIISGEFVDMEECFKRIAEKSNFAFVDSSKYKMQSISRSFHEKKDLAHNEKMQHILVFEPTKKSNIIVPGTIIAKPKSELKTVNLLEESPEDLSKISLLNSEDTNKIHGLGKYPAKFIPDIPAWAIQEYSKIGDTILDPFNGSGTTTTEAYIYNRKSIGIDISPYACLLAKAKTSCIDSEKLLPLTESFLSFLSCPNKNIKETRRLFFENDLFWFSEKALLEIESIYDYIINKIADESVTDYFLAVLSTIIKPCSFLDESQIKVKRDQRKVIKGTPSPFEMMKKALIKYQDSIEKLADFNRNRPQIINDSILNINRYIEKSSVDLVVTSPPYINAMNYAMNNRYETFLLSLINPDNSIDFQTKFIGTERVYARDYKQLHLFPVDSVLGKELNEKLSSIHKNNPKRSYIVYKYFLEMDEALKKTVDTIKEQGRFVLVAGTNTITGIPIDTFAILMKMLESNGLIYEKSFYYEIVKNALKIKRNSTSDIIKYDGIGVFRKESTK